MARGGGRRAVQWIAMSLAALFGVVFAVAVLGGLSSSDDTLGAPSTTSPDTTLPVATIPDTTLPDTIPDTIPETTSAPSTIPAAERRRRELEACEEKARDAAITYQPNKQMVVGVAEVVEVVATVGAAAPPTSLPGDEPSEQRDAPLACRVEAELTGLDFDIEPSGPQQASFLSADQVSWSWIVEPQESGSGLPLQLTVRGFVEGASDVGGSQELARGPEPIIVAISVDAQPRSFTERVADMWWGFWDSRLWTGIAGVLALLAFFGVRGREPNRREKPKPPRTLPPPLPPPGGGPAGV